MKRFAPLAALLLGACMLGPNYRPAPTPAVAAGGFTGGSIAVAVSEPTILGKRARSGWPRSKFLIV